MSTAVITILIPTMNRSDFLIRLLRYYWALGFQGCICIGDSSDTVHVERAKRAIKFFQDKLNITYQEYPHLNEAMCLHKMHDSVSTPYAVYVADDDFLVPSALEECARFLDAHPEYSSAHGVGVTIRLQPSGVYRQVVSVAHYQQPVIEEESASQRLTNLLSNYMVTIFSLHRIENRREMYRDVPLLTDRRLAAELHPSCVSVIQGKVKELDCLYLVRQAHDQRYILPGKAEWTRSANFISSYPIFCDCLAKELMRQDGISMEEAQVVVEQAFSSYLTKSFVEPWHSRFGIPRLLQIGRMVPGARYVWRASRWILRSLNLVGRDETPLIRFLSASSPYHDDFMPVYRSLTEVPAELPEEQSNFGYMV